MSCQTYKLQNIEKGCLDNVGGIKVVYAIKREDVASIAIDSTGDSATEKVTGITTASTYDVTGGSIARWAFRKGTASMTSTFNVDDAAGTSYVQTDLSLVFNKQDYALRLQVLAACYDDLYMIVIDNNKKIWLLGKDNAVNASAAGAESGTAFSDRNAYTVTLTDISSLMPHAVDDSSTMKTALEGLGILASDLA